MSNEFIAVLANLALTLSVIVAVIFGIAQVRAAARDRRERLTLETLRNFQTKEFAEQILHISTAQMPDTLKQWNMLPRDEKILLIQFAQEMESLGMLVGERLIDIDLIDKTLGSFVTTSWARYQTVFTDMREKNNDPFLGEYFQWLAERINERMEKNPRKPFFEDSHSLPV